MDENNETSYGGISKINSAGLVNSTLTNLWQDFFRHFRNGQFLSANSDLDCIWTILGGEKPIKGEKDPYEDYKTIEGDLEKLGVLRDTLDVKGFGKINDGQLIKLASQKKKLLEKSLFLRRLQNTQGKGTAYVDENEDDWGD